MRPKNTTKIIEQLKKINVNAVSIPLEATKLLNEIRYGDRPVTIIPVDLDFYYDHCHDEFSDSFDYSVTIQAWATPVYHHGIRGLFSKPKMYFYASRDAARVASIKHRVFEADRIM